MGKANGSRLAGLTPLQQRFPIRWAFILIRKQLHRYKLTLEAPSSLMVKSGMFDGKLAVFVVLALHVLLIVWLGE